MTGAPLALTALAATTVIEVGVLLVLLVPRGVDAARVIVVGIVANVVTHPFLWWFVARHDDDPASYALAVVGGEVGVALVEWGILAVGLRRHDRPAIELLAVVVVANAVTTAVGLAVALAR